MMPVPIAGTALVPGRAPDAVLSRPGQAPGFAPTPVVVDVQFPVSSMVYGEWNNAAVVFNCA